MGGNENKRKKRKMTLVKRWRACREINIFLGFEVRKCIKTLRAPLQNEN